MKPIIAITAGDTNGVGYEVIIKALLESHIFEICRPVIYGNAVVAKHHIQTLDEDHRNIQWNTIEDASTAKDGRLNMITCYTICQCNLAYLRRRPTKQPKHRWIVRAAI